MTKLYTAGSHQGAVRHLVVSWLMECGHTVVCHCQHRIGSRIWCPYCGWSVVKDKEITVHRSKAEAREVSLDNRTR